MFVNRFYGTDEMLKEYINKILCKKIRKKNIPFVIVALIVLCICINNHDYVIAGILACAAFILSFIAIFMPVFMFKEIKKQDKIMHNGADPETIITFGDKIIMEEGDVTLSFAYAQIIKLYKLDLCWALMISKDNGIMIEPNSFDDKSCDEFEKFIYEKCENLKRKQIIEVIKWLERKTEIKENYLK